MPITINQIHAGDITAIERLYAGLLTDENRGVYHTVLCHDYGPLFDADTFHANLERHPVLKPAYAGDGDFATCKLWGAGEADRAAVQPVLSDIPALLLTGSDYDPATPPAYAKLADSTLSHSFFYEFPMYSHAISVNDCPKAMMAAFLDNPSVAPDSSCIAQIEGLPFVTDVYLNPGVLSIFYAFRGDPNPWIIGATGVIALLFLSALVYLPIAYSLSRRRGDGQPPANAARLILWVVALLNLIFCAGVWLLLEKAGAETYFWATLFGFSPVSSEHLFFLPWLTAILTVGLLAFTVLAWKNRWWGRLERILYTVVTLTAASFIGFLLYLKVLSL